MEGNGAAPSFVRRFAVSVPYPTTHAFFLGDARHLLRGIPDHSIHLVVVRPQNTANNGNIVVALLMNESPTGEGVATLKRLYRERGNIRLQPANSDMQPSYVDPENLEVQGKVVSLIRNL